MLPIIADVASIDLYLNARCDLSCSTCFLGDAYFDGSSMDTGTAREILTWSRSRGASDVALLGGEPTLHQSLAEIARAARSLGYTSIRLVTNGGKRFLRVLPNIAPYLDTVYISLDGSSPSLHDSVRGVGSFANVVKAFKAVQSTGLSLVATVTVGTHNQGEVEAIVRLSDRLGANRVNIHWLSPTGRAKDAGLALSAPEWLDVRQRVRQIAFSSGLQIDIQRAFADSDDGSQSLSQCAVRDGSNLQFMPSGAVHACGLTVSEPEKSAYVWTNGSLRRRIGHTELVLCEQASPDRGCPLRTSDEAVPVCIYLRDTPCSINEKTGR